MKDKNSLNRFLKNVRRVYGDALFEEALILMVDKDNITVIESDFNPVKFIKLIQNGIFTDFEITIMAKNLLALKQINEKLYEEIINDLKDDKYALLDKAVSIIKETEEGD